MLLCSRSGPALRVDASDLLVTVRRATRLDHRAARARARLGLCAACRRGSRDTTTGGERGGDTVLRSSFLPTAVVTVVGGSEGRRGPAFSANSCTIPCGINRCRRLKLPNELFVALPCERIDRIESVLIWYNSYCM